MADYAYTSNETASASDSAASQTGVAYKRTRNETVTAVEGKMETTGYGTTSYLSTFVSLKSNCTRRREAREVPRGSPLRTSNQKFCMNRGRNTGGGAAYVYWMSPNSPDPTGVYYTGSVPWGQITDVLWVGTTYPTNR